MASSHYILVLAVSLVLIGAHNVQGGGPTQFTPHMEEVRCANADCTTEKWGYTEVRPGAHMFWWLYYSTHPQGYQNRPWIIWLQGGPGLSGTGVGNFLEIGPLDQNLTDRETTWFRFSRLASFVCKKAGPQNHGCVPYHWLKNTHVQWVQDASVLFIDQPVGTGFSYVDDPAVIPAGIHNISQQLLDFLHVFLDLNPEFKTAPLYLFGQSYGGKYAPGLGYHLEHARQAGKIEVNLVSVSIGNGFVSPLDVAQTYGTLLYQMGYIDDTALVKYNGMVEEFACLREAGKWLEADKAFWDGKDYLFKNAPGMNFYDIMDLRPVPKHLRSRRSIAELDPIESEDSLSIYEVNLRPFMDSTIREKLQIIPDEVAWSDLKVKSMVKDAQNNFDSMGDVIYMVDWLLQNSDVQVNVYEGHLDMACPTAAALAWIDKLVWPGIHQYRDADRITLVDPGTGVVEMFVKAFGNLRVYWNIGAGHAVPADTPEAALRMLRRILNNEDERTTTPGGQNNGTSPTKQPREGCSAGCGCYSASTSRTLILVSLILTAQWLLSIVMKSD